MVVNSLFDRYTFFTAIPLKCRLISNNEFHNSHIRKIYISRYARYLRKYFKLTLCPPNDHKMQMDRFYSNSGYYDILERLGF